MDVPGCRSLLLPGGMTRRRWRTLRTVVFACVCLWSLPSPSQAQVTAGSVQIIPVGCYTNETQADISTMTIYDPLLKLPSCILACVRQGMKYASVSNRQYCFCGSNLDPETNPHRVSSSECNRYCDTEFKHPCGANQRLSAYKAECAPGLYGKEVTCRLPCGHCRNTLNEQPVCDVKTGNCDAQGCQAGYQGSRCRDECPVGKFGDSCSRDCFCPQNEKCHPETGTCTGSCAAGYRRDGTGSCSESCPDGLFGPDCLHSCHCTGDAFCDRVTGSCPEKCAAGWAGLNCSKVCQPRWFGENCEQECHCKNDGHCDVVNGICDISECAAGWHGESCHLECAETHFGPNCIHRCRCKNDEPCNRVDGRCENGCLTGFTGRNCRTECAEGKFGDNCEGICNCLHNKPCDHVTGECEDGCAAGWIGKTCSDRGSTATFLPTEPSNHTGAWIHSKGQSEGGIKSTEPQTGGSLGNEDMPQMWTFIMVGLLGVIVLLAMVMCIFMVFRKRQKSKDRHDLDSLASSVRRYIHPEDMSRQNSCGVSAGGRTMSWVSQQTAETESNLYAEIPEVGNLSNSSYRREPEKQSRSLGYVTPEEHRPLPPITCQSLPRDYSRSMSQPAETDYMQPRPSPVPGHGDGPGYGGYHGRGRTMPRLQEPMGHGGDHPPSKIMEESFEEPDEYSRLTGPAVPPGIPRNRSLSTPAHGNPPPTPTGMNGFEHIYLDMNKSREELNHA